jgi:hypothetical protein
MAQYLSLPMRIVYWKESAAEDDGALHSVVQYKTLLKDVFPELVIDVDIIQEPLAPWLPNVEFERDTLVTMPALPEPGASMTPFGVSSDMVVRYCGLPCLLLWLDSRQEAANIPGHAETAQSEAPPFSPGEEHSSQLRERGSGPSVAASV